MTSHHYTTPLSDKTANQRLQGVGTGISKQALVSPTTPICDTGVLVRALAKPGFTAPCGFLVRPSTWLTDLACDSSLTATATLLAASDLAVRAKRSAPDWTTFVEFGQAQILAMQTVRDFGLLARTSDLATSHLTLIVDISEVLTNPHLALERMAMLKSMGFRLCLDGVDPQAPHSLLLERLAIDSVRVDFRDRPTHRQQEGRVAWSEKLIDLAYFLDNLLISMVAAGIRVSSEVELAEVAGCSMHHGPMAGRQLPADHALNLLPSDLET